MTCFFTYPPEIKEFAAFAEYLGPQLIKQGSVSELMKLIRQTDVVKAAVQYLGEIRAGGLVIKTKKKSGKKTEGPPLKKVSVQSMIDDIRNTFPISNDEALFIRQITEEKIEDPQIREVVHIHKTDIIYLDDVFKSQVNQQIQQSYADHDRYDELADPKYIDSGAIFDLMAYTVIHQNLSEGMAA